MKSGGVTNVCVYFYLVISILGFCRTSAFYNRPDSVSSNLTRIRRQLNTCDGFRCTTTEVCINGTKRCDGNVDCEDGSDEFNDCKYFQKCPKNMFTCDYGACIITDKKCDGKKDCRDNSDETNCVISRDSDDNISQTCKSDQFQCKSGECISSTNKCNGIIDCGDRSDETKDACLNKYCRGFICDYGACVSGNAKCNGVNDCIDNSDEENCQDTTPRPAPFTSRPFHRQSTCKLPEHPDHGKWVILDGASKQPGERVATITLLIFSCDGGYKLSSENKFLACYRDGWSAKPPECSRLCPPLYTTEITKVSCHDERQIEIKCSEAISRATARFSCAAYYESSDRSSMVRFCWDATWNLPPPVCAPVCGMKISRGTPLIIDGSEVQQGNYPWVAAVFLEHKGKFVNTCGGTLLTQRIILTAAHCITDSYQVAKEAKTIKIAVGKYYYEYQDIRDTQAQYSDVQKVIVHNTYRGDSQRYSSDIGVLVTKDMILLSKVVQPICIWNLRSISLVANMTGTISGWKFAPAGQQATDVLKEESVTYMSDDTCESILPPEWLDKYMTYDKFCAVFSNRNMSINLGNSGASLVFKNNDGRYYVHGILSVAPRQTNENEPQTAALYTKIATHADWLEKIITEYSK